MNWETTRDQIIRKIYTKDAPNDIYNNKDKKKQNYAIAEFIINEVEIITTYDNEQVFIYSNGYYQPFGENKLKEIIQVILEEDATTTRVNEIINHVKRMTFKERDLFEKTPKNLICLKNGVYDLNTKKLLPHSNEIYFNSQIPINYNPKAKCPKIINFIREIVEKKDRKTLYEISAYCLYRDNFLQKAFMFVGSGANGKSTFLNLLIKLIGEENTSNTELQELAENRFAISDLFGKHINVFADLPEKALKQTGKFKAIVGGDRIQGEYKYKNSFSFQPFAKLLFSANLLPKTNDDTDAFHRRWMIISFPKTFSEKNVKKNLLNELTTQEELEGFLFILLNVLNELLKKKKFSNELGVEEVREMYTRLSDPVGSFILDKIEVVSNLLVPKQKLYSAFFDYCKKNGYPVVSVKSFSIQLQKSVRVEDYYAKLFGVRVKCWAGIRYINDEGEEDISFSTETQDIM